ncbi:unnamed protein product [Rhizophagus irregularis]|nr:unnamed protein product [Rhizophagus irregularis]
MNLDRAYLSELNGDDEGWQLAVFMKFSRDHGHPILEFFSQYNIQLSNNSSSLSTSLLQNINNIDSNSLTWENPLANGIISDNDTSILNNDKLSDLYKKFTYNKQWIENNEELEKITTNILNVIENNWSNSAFTLEFAKEQSEGTYVADIIIPYFLQYNAERQSIASADRIKEGDDEIKLWREANNGMFWIKTLRKPEKEQFTIIGIQIAGKEIYLNALMTDKQNINRYYHLQKTEVPIQKTEKSIKVLPKFVKLLLNLRNILMINLSLLTNAPKVYTRRTKSSSTISSPKRDEDKQKKVNKRKQKKTSKTTN